jgi:hypothetical protein
MLPSCNSTHQTLLFREQANSHARSVSRLCSQQLPTTPFCASDADSEFQSAMPCHSGPSITLLARASFVHACWLHALHCVAPNLSAAVELISFSSKEHAVNSLSAVHLHRAQCELALPTSHSCESTHNSSKPTYTNTHGKECGRLRGCWCPECKDKHTRVFLFQRKLG